MSLKIDDPSALNLLPNIQFSGTEEGSGAEDFCAKWKTLEPFPIQLTETIRAHLVHSLVPPHWPLSVSDVPSSLMPHSLVQQGLQRQRKATLFWGLKTFFNLSWQSCVRGGSRIPLSVSLYPYFLPRLRLILTPRCVRHILVPVYLDWHGQRLRNWNLFRELVEGVWCRGAGLNASQRLTVGAPVHHFSSAALKSRRSRRGNEAR